MEYTLEVLWRFINFLRLNDSTRKLGNLLSGLHADSESQAVRFRPIKSFAHMAACDQAAELNALSTSAEEQAG